MKLLPILSSQTIINLLDSTSRIPQIVFLGVYDDNPALIAATVQRGNQVLTLRDDNDIPAWSRRSQQGGQLRPCCIH
ncbi:MAG: hypothetical protein F6K19_24365 [Cyanothece sp. SIO1E1]|nr:hypothetical protein [Cyanothece sp. SIO1E1]